MGKKLSDPFAPKIKGVDKSLDKYLEQDVFKEKFDKMNRLIDKYGLPDFDKK